MNKNKIMKALMSILLAAAMIMPVSQPILAEGDVFSTVSIGSWYSLAIKSDGSLLTWGSNTFGQLGDGTNDEKHTPVKVMDDVSSVSAGSFHTMAIKTDGSLWAWGRNVGGQLGDGSNEDKNMPVKIMDNVLAVSAGGEHTVAIKTDGSLWVWGDNSDGQLGDGTNDSQNKPIKVMDDVIFISAGGSHTMAIKTDSSLWAWGWNINGQLGDGSIKASNAPIKIMDDVSIVSAGFAYTMAITKDNSLWTWASYTGQISSTANPYPKTPTKVMDDVLNVSTGTGYSMIIKTDGSLWAWGRNDKGQLGDGTNDDKYDLIKIMDDVAAVSANYHSIAIKTDGSLWTWGSNEKGELGDGTNDDKNTPIKIMEDAMLPSNAPVIYAPQESIKVILNDEELTFDVPPQLINDRTMVPMRVIFEALGAEVKWVDETQTIYATRKTEAGGVSPRVILQIGNFEMRIMRDNLIETLPNGNSSFARTEETIELDVAPIIINDRTLVPLRAVSEAFDAEVEWVDATQKVLITAEKIKIIPVKESFPKIEGEVEIDINDPEVQELFNSAMNGESFIAYYTGYADIALLDSPENIIGGRMRELFSVLSLKDVPDKKYTDAEASEIISQFLSKGEITEDMFQYGLDNLKAALNRGMKFGETASQERLVAVYKKNEIDEYSKNLFGMPLPKAESAAYSIAYASFFLYNRTNLLERFPTALPYNLYYNEASEEYLFTADLSMLSQWEMEDYLEYYNHWYEPLKSNTELLRATRHNDEVSLYIYREAEFGEYSGGTGVYKGEYRNTYKKSENGFSWIRSYGIDE